MLVRVGLLGVCLAKDVLVVSSEMFFFLRLMLGIESSHGHK